MSFITKIFKPNAGSQSQASAPVEAPSLVKTAPEAMSPNKPKRARSGTQTKFGGVLDTAQQATAAKKTLLGE